MKAYMERIYNGLIKENPTFVLFLGICPTLAVTTSALNGVGMGLSTMAVLVMSNLLISLLRKVIPSQVRMPAYITIIASFVTIVHLLLEAYVPSLYESLGLYIPLIVVNCIILGRAEAYASSHSVGLSLFDGIGMGLGFTVALTCIGAVRELLGAGTVLGFTVPVYEPATIFILAPGAFFVLAALAAVMNRVQHGNGRTSTTDSCLEGCEHCTNMGCGGRVFTRAAVSETEEADVPAGGAEEIEKPAAAEEKEGQE